MLSKQVFDLEFLAADPGGFVPVYLGEMDRATLATPLRLRQRARP